jgi:hypothetical protein
MNNIKYLFQNPILSYDDSKDGYIIDSEGKIERCEYLGETSSDIESPLHATSKYYLYKGNTYSFEETIVGFGEAIEKNPLFDLLHGKRKHKSYLFIDSIKTLYEHLMYKEFKGVQTAYLLNQEDMAFGRIIKFPIISPIDVTREYFRLKQKNVYLNEDEVRKELKTSIVPLMKGNLKEFNEIIDRVRLYSNSDTASVKTKDKEDIAIGDLCLVQYTCFNNYIYHTSYELIHSIDENNLLRDEKNNIIPREFVKIVYDGTSLKSTLMDSFKIKDDMKYADRMSKFLSECIRDTESVALNHLKPLEYSGCDLHRILVMRAKLIDYINTYMLFAKRSHY